MWIPPSGFRVLYCLAWVLKQHANRYVDLENKGSNESILVLYTKQKSPLESCFLNFGVAKLNMCYYGGKEIGKVASGRQLLKNEKLKGSINHVPHPSYLPPAPLRIWVDLNGSGSIRVDLGPRGATNRKRLHREPVCEVMNCETNMCMLDLLIVCQAQGFLRNNIGTYVAAGRQNRFLHFFVMLDASFYITLTILPVGAQKG